jgi:hypothetical protein
MHVAHRTCKLETSAHDKRVLCSNTVSRALNQQKGQACYTWVRPEACLNRGNAPSGPSGRSTRLERARADCIGRMGGAEAAKRQQGERVGWVPVSVASNCGVAWDGACLGTKLGSPIRIQINIVVGHGQEPEFKTKQTTNGHGAANETSGVTDVIHVLYGTNDTVSTRECFYQRANVLWPGCVLVVGRDPPCGSHQQCPCHVRSSFCKDPRCMACAEAHQCTTGSS